MANQPRWLLLGMTKYEIIKGEYKMAMEFIVQNLIRENRVCKTAGIIMSKIGEDFLKGGFYFKSSKSKKINIEKRLEEGDAVIFYGSIAHGVEKVDPQKKLSWTSNKGRWFIGMFVNDSDHVRNRITAEDLTGSVKTKSEFK